MPHLVRHAVAIFVGLAICIILGDHLGDAQPEHDRPVARESLKDDVLVVDKLRVGEGGEGKVGRKGG